MTPLLAVASAALDQEDTLDWQLVLAAIMRQTGASTTELAGATGLSQSYISRLATGKSRHPSMSSVQALCDGLGIPRVLAGLAPKGNDWEVTGQAGAEVSATNRRDVITALASVVATGPIARLLANAEQRVGSEDAASVRQLVRHLDNLDDRFGGGSLCDVAVRCVRSVEEVLDCSHYSDAAGRELQAAYGELVGYSGWLHFDACRHPTAKMLFNEALCVAQLVDDRDLEVFTLASLSLQARHLDRPRAAVQFAQRARQRAQGLLTPRLEALLLSREAAGWAGLGDRGAFHRLSRTAQATFSDVSPDDPPWISFLDEAELKVTEGLAWRLLGDAPRAESSLRAAIGDIPESKPRNQASYRIILADVLAQRGDISGACESVSMALPKLSTTSSGRARERWTTAWRALRCHTRRPDVRDVAARAFALGLVSASDMESA